MVARTLGWALLFGGSPVVVNKALVLLGLISALLPFMFTETGVVIAFAHVLMPHMVLAVGRPCSGSDPQVENAAVALGAGPVTVLRRIVLPQIMPGIPSGRVIVRPGGERLRNACHHWRAAVKVASTLAYDEFLNTLNWLLGAAVAVLLLVALVLLVVASRLVERRYAQVFSWRPFNLRHRGRWPEGPEGGRRQARPPDADRRNLN